MKKLYPWLLVLISLLAITVNNGLSSSITSVFDNYLKIEFNISKDNLAVLKLRDSITNISAALFVFFAGVLLDKWGAKRVILFGSVILALAYFLYSKVNSIYQIYGIHVLLALALATSGSMPNIILISTWFKKYRGLALGIILTGTSMGGLLFPIPLNAYISTEGWRSAMVLLATMPIILMVLVILFVKNTPKEIGLKALGEEENNTSEELIKTGLDFKQALRKPMFWLIGFCGFLTFYAVVSIVSNTVLYGLESGLKVGEAVKLLSIYAVFAVIGKFFFSFLTDYFSPYLIFTVCCLIMLAGSLGYVSMQIDWLWYTLPMMAFGWGGIYTLYNIMIVRNFGLKSAGKINGSISVLESIGSALGPVMTAFIHDKTGNYQMSFVLISSFLLITAVLSFGFRRFEVRG